MSPSIWQLLIVLAIVLVLFGAKRLRNLGGDLGSAVKGFKTAMREGENEEQQDDEQREPAGRIGDGEDDGDHHFEGERPRESAGERK